MYIQLRRHSTKQEIGNSDLSVEGIQLAKKIGREQLSDMRFTHFYTSPVKRTQQTLKLFAEGAGDFSDISPELFLGEINPLSSSMALELWEGACHDAESKGDDMMIAAVEQAPEKTKALATKTKEVFLKWVETMPSEAKAFVVNHSPAIEVLIYALTGKIIAQLQPCEGVVILIEGKLISFEEIRQR